MSNGRNPRNIAPAVGGLFPPQSKSLGIDGSHFSPALQAKITFGGSNNTSYAQAEQALRVLAEIDVSDKQTRRVCKQVGLQRVAQRDAAVTAYQAKPLTERKAAPPGVTAPDLAVVGTDGGRMQIMERTAHSQAIIRAAEIIQDDVAVPESAPPRARKPMHWREDKIGLLLTMTSERHATDPCPQIPESFVNPHWISELAKELKGRASARGSDTLVAAEMPAPPTPATAHTWQPPEALSKHLVASRRPWEQFGPMVAERAWSLGFFAAPRRAFLGDGAENNWTLWRQYFSSFVPILDFIHALTYVFHSALAGRTWTDGWTIYQRWIGWLWGGEVEKIIAELAARQVELGPVGADAKETNPGAIVARALGYLQNHKEKMRYATYRKDGLPIVSSYVESAVKQFNYRVKGTEKFWREQGAEEILQLRGDYLSDDKPMTAFWQDRQATATGQVPYRRAA